MTEKRENILDVDMVDVYEQMLYQRATRGIRPVLYVSSYTDLECSMLMLLDEDADDFGFGSKQRLAAGIGYHVTPN